VDGLTVGKVRVNPEAVTSLEIGDLGDRKCDACALDADFYSGTD
jgi:hypothetical protein